MAPDWDAPHNPHPIFNPSSLARAKGRKEAHQHELLIFPPSTVYLNSVNRKEGGREGKAIPLGTWTVEPIEMLYVAFYGKELLSQ